MRAKSEMELSVLRMLISSLKNKKIELKKQEDLNDEEVIAVIRSEVKKRNDSIESYRAGGRDDLVQKEEAELKVLDKYLPEQMGEEEIKTKAAQIIKDNGFARADFGRAMGAVMGVLKGQADGVVVQKIVKELLN